MSNLPFLEPPFRRGSHLKVCSPHSWGHISFLNFDCSYSEEHFEIVNKSFYDWEARVVPIMENQLLILDDYAGSASSQEQLIIVDIVITIFTTIACLFVAVTIWLLNQVFLEMRDRTDQLRVGHLHHCFLASTLNLKLNMVRTKQTKLTIYCIKCYQSL